MYTIEQLNEKTDLELKEVAQSLNLKDGKSDRKDLIYSILDAQAEQTVVTKPVRRRQRIGEKTQVEAVYSADKKGVGKAMDDAPVKKKRGRPSKAELAKRADEAANSLFGPITEATPKSESKKNEEVVEKESVEVSPQTQPIDKVSSESDSSASTPVIESETAVSVSLQKNEEEVPEFVAEQLEKLSTEEQHVKEEKSPETKEENKPASSPTYKNVLKVDEDFYILKDYNDESPAMLSQTSSSKFRRYKDDPIVNGASTAEVQTENTKAQTRPVENKPKEIDFAIEATGVLEIQSDNSGILRSADYNYLPSPDDISVGGALIRQYALKTGDTVVGMIRMPKANEKHYVLTSVTEVNGLDPKVVCDRVAFEHLTPLFPDQKFRLCSGVQDTLSCRVVDLFTPIGKGQRALIVAQPKTGKTWLMKDIANAIARNNPNTYLMMLLIDERPEEVTDMIRTVDAEVIASTFDEPAAHHVKIAKLVLEKAKRMVECGHDVVIFLDSITRLARAYNTVSPSSGKVLTGGVEANSLQHPKRFFGAARNIEGGGSLTIIATALIDTGSKMDEVIFEEFKGTGNMELQLDRNLSNKRIYPAVNLVASSTRRDDLLLDDITQKRMWVLRNFIADMNPVEAMTEISKRFNATHNNEEFIVSMNS
ncbi:MAG: transcription termination factor Rho [Alloprevotella sp.]|nr:transcription termination factor Rho [Alloprevotella sp.]